MRGIVWLRATRLREMSERRLGARLLFTSSSAPSLYLFSSWTGNDITTAVGVQETENPGKSEAAPRMSQTRVRTGKTMAAYFPFVQAHYLFEQFNAKIT